jgi:hypothetical protein
MTVRIDLVTLSASVSGAGYLPYWQILAKTKVIGQMSSKMKGKKRKNERSGEKVCSFIR